MLSGTLVELRYNAISLEHRSPRGAERMMYFLLTQGSCLPRSSAAWSLTVLRLRHDQFHDRFIPSPDTVVRKCPISYEPPLPISIGERRPEPGCKFEPGPYPRGSAETVAPAGRRGCYKSRGQSVRPGFRSAGRTTTTTVFFFQQNG